MSLLDCDLNINIGDIIVSNLKPHLEDDTVYPIKFCGFFDKDMRQIEYDRKSDEYYVWVKFELYTNAALIYIIKDICTYGMFPKHFSAVNFRILLNMAWSTKYHLVPIKLDDVLEYDPNSRIMISLF